MDDYWHEDLTTFGGLIRDWAALLTRRQGRSLQRIYLTLGLPLLVLVTAGAYLYAMLREPWMLDSCAGGYRADMLMLFSGAPSVVLAGLLVSYLLPRALYGAYMRYTHAPDGAKARFLTTYWAAMACVLGLVLTSVAIVWGGEALIKRLPIGRASLASNALKSFVWCVAWPNAMILQLAFPVTLCERESGFGAIKRAFRIYWRVLGNANILFALPLIIFLGAHLLILLITKPLAAVSRMGNTAAMAFWVTLNVPCACLLLVSMCCALYSAAVSPDGQRGMVRQGLYRRIATMKRSNASDAVNQSIWRERTNMMDRSDIPASLKWNLDDIYPSEETWEADFARAKALVAAFCAHAGKLSQDADALYAALRDESDLSRLIERLYSYAHLHRDEDNGAVLYQGMTDRAMQLYTSAAAASAFVDPELLTIPADTLHEWMDQTRFSPFRFRLRDVDRRRAHTLSANEERLLAMADEPLSGADNIFTMLSDVDLDFGTVTDENGETVKLTHGSYGMLLTSPDRRVRREAYERLYRVYRSFGNTVSATYATSVKTDVFRARAHRFDGALEAALFDNGVPIAVYEQLIEAVHQALPSLNKYLGIRRRVLGVDELEMYDLYVPLVTDIDEKMTYEQAKALVKAALQPLGEAYGELLERAYTAGWIDVYETPGKTSGAFCSGLYGVHPYVLLNFQGRIDDAFTLGHELGHAMHSYHSDDAQPYETAEYRTMVAEVASTVNETLMTHYLLDRETDRRKRAYYITQFLESFRTTCFRQTMFAEFELKAHRMAENGEPLTIESLSRLYRGLNELYYAGAHVDDDIAIEWMRIPHFYSAFYVYQYATGLCSAVKLAEDILENGAVERYMAFLSSGGSDYPIELLKAAGVDLTRKESLLTALDVFAKLVDELDALMP